MTENETEPIESYQTTLNDSASSNEVEAFEERFGHTHPVFRVPHRPERKTV